MSTALITGASRGLGRALARALAERGWTLILDARGAHDLESVVRKLSPFTRVVGIPGDVTDPAHRRKLVELAAADGPVDLVVNNASTLGESPLPQLAEADLDAFVSVLDTNVVAPLAVLQAVAPHLSLDAAVVNMTSDAAVEPYEGWGLYGASKAALDQLSAVLAAENPGWHVYSFDPGDMRTAMHQEAFPGEDISDRPEPEEVVPSLLALLDRLPASGRVVASEMGVGAA